MSHPQRDPVELSEDRYDIAFKPLVTADKLLLVAPGVADGHRRPNRADRYSEVMGRHTGTGRPGGRIHSSSAPLGSTV